MGYNVVVVGSQSQNREIPTKFDLTAVRGHPRSSILVSVKSQSSTVFEILTLGPKARKWLIFHTPPLFDAPHSGEPIRISG